MVKLFFKKACGLQGRALRSFPAMAQPERNQGTGRTPPKAGSLQPQPVGRKLFPLTEAHLAEFPPVSNKTKGHPISWVSFFAWLHVHYEQAFLAERELRLYGAIDKLGCAAVAVSGAERVDK